MQVGPAESAGAESVSIVHLRPDVFRGEGVSQRRSAGYGQGSRGGAVGNELARGEIGGGEDGLAAEILGRIGGHDRSADEIDGADAVSGLVGGRADYLVGCGNARFASGASRALRARGAAQLFSNVRRNAVFEKGAQRGEEDFARYSAGSLSREALGRRVCGFLRTFLRDYFYRIFFLRLSDNFHLRGFSQIRRIFQNFLGYIYTR